MYISGAAHSNQRSFRVPNDPASDTEDRIISMCVNYWVEYVGITLVDCSLAPILIALHSVFGLVGTLVGSVVLVDANKVEGLGYQS